jgi:hypothetical protein
VTPPAKKDNERVSTDIAKATAALSTHLLVNTPEFTIGVHAAQNTRQHGMCARVVGLQAKSQVARTLCVVGPREAQQTVGAVDSPVAQRTGLRLRLAQEQRIVQLLGDGEIAPRKRFRGSHHFLSLTKKPRQNQHRWSILTPQGLRTKNVDLAVQHRTV